MNQLEQGGYVWSPPLLRRGDIADYYDHRGNLKHGECMWIETHYSQLHGEGPHIAYHIYDMRGDGHERRTIVGEKQIIGGSDRDSKRSSKQRRR